MKKPTMILKTDRPFAYEGTNVVRAYLNGRNVSEAVAVLHSAYFSGAQYEGTNLAVPGENELYIAGCESFSLDDFAGCIEDFLDLEIAIEEGRGKPMKTPKANERQVGGSHYRKVDGEQHWDRLVRLKGLEKSRAYFAFTATAYIERYEDKNGVEDLRKAVHFLEKLIELEEAEALKNLSPKEKNER